MTKRNEIRVFIGAAVRAGETDDDDRPYRLDIYIYIGCLGYSN